MKKRLFCIVLLALLMAVSAALASPPCTHNWVLQTTLPTCTENGASFQHCTLCGAVQDYTVIPKVGHAWGAWNVDVAATCTAPGSQSRECTVCHTKEYKPVPMVAHTWGAWAIETPPTCFAPGREAKECTVCHTKEYKPIAQLTHAWGGWVEATAPTCFAPGLETNTCPNCSTVQRRTKAQLQHQWGPWAPKTAPTCTAPGSEVSVCALCLTEQYRSVKPTGHTFGPWGPHTAPTCTQGGLEKRICSVCLFEQFRPLPAAGHTMGPWGVATAPTCTAGGIEKQVCSVCGHENVRTTKALGHDYGVGWVRTLEPTCSAYGEDRRVCVRCLRTETRRVKRVKHTPGGWMAMPAPSLERPGRKVRYCDVCNKMVDSQQYAPATYRYGMGVSAFGPFAYQFNPALIASSDRLVPVDFTSAERQTLPLVTADNFYIGDVVIDVRDGILSVHTRLNDPKTVVVNGSYMVFANVADITPDALTYRAQMVELGSATPVTGSKGILVLRMNVNYDQKTNRAFSEGGAYVDGASSTSDVLRQMVAELNAMNGDASPAYTVEEGKP